MINSDQLIEYVIRPTLKELNMYSQAAENLMIGTAAHESRLEYLHQVHGPAIGLWQMEPFTHNDIFETYLKFRGDMSSNVRRIAGAKYLTLAVDPNEMHGNLYYACAMARIKYYRSPDQIPDKDDIEGLAAYWKKIYNSESGRGKPEQFVDAYRRVMA